MRRKWILLLFVFNPHIFLQHEAGECSSSQRTQPPWFDTLLSKIDTRIAPILRQLDQISPMQRQIDQVVSQLELIGLQICNLQEILDELVPPPTDG